MHSTAKPYALSAEHAAYFTARAIDPERAIAHGFHTVDGAEAARLLGRDAALPCGGIAMPYPGTKTETGEYVRVRCDAPELSGARYLAPAGVAVPIYVPHGFVLDDRPIVVVESPVKAVALALAAYAAIGLGGVTTGLDTESESPRLNAWWSTLLGPDAVRGRRVIIMFDTNRATNAQVAWAEARLARGLRHAGADVRVARLNRVVPYQNDAGPDDVLALPNGADLIARTLEAAVSADPVEWVKNTSNATEVLSDLGFAMAVAVGPDGTASDLGDAFKKRGWQRRELNRAVTQAKQRLAATNSEIAAPLYASADNQLVELRADGNHRLIAGFLPRIVEEIHRNDGVEVAIEYLVEATAADGAPLGTRSVRPAELERVSWAQTHFGAKAVVYGSPRELATAMQAVSTPRRVDVRTHLGFFEHDGALCYAHAGGVIGAPEIRVDPPTELRCYTLSDEAPDIEAGFRALWRLTKAAPTPIGVALVALVADGLLQRFKPSPFVSMLVGPTRQGKTRLARAQMQAYGHVPVRLTTGFDSTAAALENLIFAGADVLVAVDDYAPRSSDPRDEMTRKAETVIRNVANRTARSRMTSGMESQRVRLPRAAVLITGEVRPGMVQSVANRILLLPIRKGDVDFSVLDEIWRDRQVLRGFTVAMIQYIRERADHIVELLDGRLDDGRRRYRKIGHAHTAETLSHVDVSLELVLDVAHSGGVLDDDERAHLLEYGRTAIEQLGHLQERETADADPIARFLEILRDLVASSAARLDNADKDPDGDDAGTPRIGWRYESEWWLIKQEVYRAVNDALRRGAQGDLAVSARELVNMLGERGLLAPSGEDSHPYEPKRTVGLKRHRVLVLKALDEPHYDGEVDLDFVDNHSLAEPPRPKSSTSASPNQLESVELRVTTAGSSIVLRERGRLVFGFPEAGGLSGMPPRNATWVGADLHDVLVRAVRAKIKPHALFDLRIASLLLRGGQGASTPKDEDFESVRLRLAPDVDPADFVSLLHRQLKDDGLAEIADLEHRVLVATAAMEVAGVPFDPVAWRTLLKQRAEAKDEAEEYLANVVGVRFGHDDDPAMAARCPDPQAHNVLNRFRRDRAFLQDLGPKVADALDLATDGRVRARINSYGTETGRFTTTGVNLLGLEKAEEVRRCVVAPEGRAFVIIDINAADLRSLAAIAEDAALVDLFRQGKCPHRATGAALFDCAPEDLTEEQRGLAKIINFTIIFGGGPAAAVEQAEQRGLLLTVEDAATFMGRFREQFTGVARWQDEVRHAGAGTMRSLLGRPRRITDNNDCARLNAPVQMTTADGVKLAVIALHDVLYRYGARLLLVPHDEFLIEVPVERAEEVKQLAEEVIKHEFAKALLGRIPVEVASRISPTWGRKA